MEIINAAAAHAFVVDWRTSTPTRASFHVRGAAEDLRMSLATMVNASHRYSRQQVADTRAAIAVLDAEYARLTTEKSE